MSEADITIQPGNPGDPDVAALLAKSAAHLISLYPAAISEQLTGAGLDADNVRFVVARNAEGKPAAIGALVLGGEEGEIRRMWVDGLARRRGIGARVLAALTDIARAAGVKTLKLEVGNASYMALTLYEHAGFARCEPFPGRKASKFVVYMKKAI